MMGGRFHIMVVDDDPSITQTIEDILGLRCAACSVAVANSIDEASAELASGSPDTLLCDYMIDGVASTAFLETTAERFPALRRILMTGSPRREWQDLLSRGVVGAVLTKPFELSQLWSAICSEA